MKVEVQIGGKPRTVEIEAGGNRLRCQIGDRLVEADAVEVDKGIYSVLIGGECFQARVEERAGKLWVHVGGREFPVAVEDPRQWRRRSGALEAEGRQRLVAPMPGKVIRVLVNSGDAIEAGQGLLVVEAMKMQNEIRSPKSGKIERLLVQAGQAVNAGEVLVIVA